MPTARPAVFAVLLVGGAGVCLAVVGCLPRGGAFADAAAVEKVAALDGAPLPSSEWTTDVAAARARAAAENKDVLMLFTGSDWCHYCKLLDGQVFAKAPASRLTDDFVPVMLDFPAAAAPVPGAEELQEDYAVGGFPTVVLTDPAGREYGRAGYDHRYESGGAAAFVADVRSLRSAKGATTADAGTATL